MKTLITITAALLCTLTYAQKIATTFDNAIENGISIEELDNTYKSAAR